MGSTSNPAGSPLVLYNLAGQESTLTLEDLEQSLGSKANERKPSGEHGGVPLGFLGACRSVEEFEKLSRLGEGTYGIVYRARDTSSNTIVALKKIRMETDNNNGLPLSSFREITLLKSLRHDNVIRLLDVVVGYSLNNIFMAMEHCEQDLGRLLDNKKHPYTVAETKCLMQQLLAGLRYCHDHYIIHRDLKLPNLLLTSRGVLKIADFGLARTYREPIAPMTPKVVTLWYRSPELLLGETRYTTATDMWSVGCILAEFLLHKPCMPGQSEKDQLTLIINLLGTPNERIWPGIVEYPLYRNIVLPQQKYNNLRQTFVAASTETIDLMNQLFAYDPDKRISARSALKHPYFNERPHAVHRSLLPVYTDNRKSSWAQQ
ncbi:hypothetical protein H4R33_004487 [Dimargaris cristalligena]|uniref:Cyclin-dependent kinase 10 n=1 Tax=Dimargaris cristalligena TaxID=215637 RepID=A0A4V1J4X7_9FUNG|nr:hypothetical protein H4R33_004487 [Dimargaris cristalligena]RKP37099.1 cyclin-dependent kinase 10 [Dimargaris cristalligena]|eukprot:RKP37099.1 cyclin-dependent kinase 10 [Dimargaris cristalligena]